MSMSGEQGATERPAASASPVPLIAKLGFGLGGLGMAILLNGQGILLFYMTDTLGLAAGVGGTLLLVSKLYDMVTDPVMGTISDHSRTPWGRRRPWLLLGGVLSALAMGLLFSAPTFDDAGVRAAYMGFLLLLIATGYTVFNVPYLAMPAEMTEDYNDRTAIFSYRTAFAALGMIVAVLQPLLVQIYGGTAEDGQVADPKTGYAMMGWTLGALILIATLASFFLTERAPFTQRTQTSEPGFMVQARLALQNRPFALLALIKFLQLASLASVTSAVFFFITRVMEKPFLWISWFGLMSSAVIVVTMPLWVRLSARFGKRTIYIAATLGYALVVLTWFLAGPEEDLQTFLLRSMALGFFSAGVILMGPALLPDTIEYDYRRTGLRREGVFAGFYTTVEKLAFALGGFLIGMFLQAMGYVQAQAGQVVQQPESAINAIYFAVAGIPALLSLVSVAVLFRYDLDEAKLKSTTAPGR